MEVEVVRSRRRRKTVSATLEGQRLVVRIPARFSRKQEQEWVEHMRGRFDKRAQRRASDQVLKRRAQALNREYFGGALDFHIRWVTNQNGRWGSCTPVDATIRLSHRLQEFPEYVLDYVIVHELAHILVPDHSNRFWNLVYRYPKTERARGFLEGVAQAERAASAV